MSAIVFTTPTNKRKVRIGKPFDCWEPRLMPFANLRRRNVQMIRSVLFAICALFWQVFYS